MIQHPRLQLLIYLLFAGLVVSLPTRVVEERDHGNPKLNCKPYTTFTIARFIAANFVAHCFTLKSLPGESAFGAALVAVHTFFAPVAGVHRAYEAIIRHSRFTKGNAYEKAARAGALTMLCRSNDDGNIWAPRDQDYDLVDTEQSVRVDELNSAVPSNQSKALAPELVFTYDVIGAGLMPEPLPVILNSYTRFGDLHIHGTRRVPPGYLFASVPSDAILQPVAAPDGQIESTETEEGLSTVLSCSFNAPKAIVGIFQAAYGAYSLFQSTGDHFNQYGYAPFDLAVTPYILMAILNLIANITTPDYPAVFMVRSPEMDEAEERGGLFRGEIGKLVAEPSRKPKLPLKKISITKTRAPFRPELHLEHSEQSARAEVPDVELQPLACTGSPSENEISDQVRPRISFRYEPKSA